MTNIIAAPEITAAVLLKRQIIMQATAPAIGGAGIDMPYEYVRLLPREHIAQDSAADTGYDSDK